VRIRPHAIDDAVCAGARRNTAAAIALLAVLAGCVDEANGPSTEADDGAAGTVDAADAAVLGDEAAHATDDGDAAREDASVDAAGPTFPVELADTLRSIVESNLRAVAAPGFTVTVSSPSLGVWEHAVGLSRLSPPTAMAPGDRLRVGSITKSFNAAVAIQLEHEGVWSLDQPADNWVSGLGLGSDVTLRRLLDHTAGLFNYTDDPLFLTQPPTRPSDVVAWALEHGRVHDPGRGWSYSNTGYFVTGLAIEAATGTSFAAAVRARLLDPLELVDTATQPDELALSIVDGHVNGRENTDIVDMSWAWAAGGMVSTTGDLCRWARALYAGDALSPEVREAVLTEALLLDGTPTGYGLGTYLSVARGAVAPRGVVGHTGSTSGFRGEVFVDLATETCVAVLTNDFLAHPDRVADLVWDALPGAAPP